MAKTLNLRFGKFSRLIHIKTFWVICCLFILTIIHSLISLSLGKVFIPFDQILKELFTTTQSEYTFIIESLRLPRIVLAFLVGMALGLSGLILQNIVRNPLASPDILGVTSGASVSVVIFMTFLSAQLSLHWLPLFAILGAWCAALLIYLLSWKSGTTSIRLVLMGIGISTILGAITTLTLVLGPLNTTLSTFVWLTGSVYGALWQDIAHLSIWLILIIPLLIFFSRHLNPHELEDSILVGLGLNPEPNRMCLLFIAVALAAVAIAYAGAIAFVGLIAPHIARMFVPRSFGGLAWVSGLVGANLVMLADLIGRTVFLPLDLPAGIFIAVFGTPFFIYLLLKQRF
ncbi:iron ABC transporter permease [Acinetobacter sp. R933-2]|uniref:FecCD family ABC transporter permease n=1 Tax=Acinetobacter TaxID=469 RepID=UPI0025784F85|nr:MULTISPECIES: iron ABC transporter permease [Acinetobacter]MDM1249187.1 iron ABC transporter permease [Acinetobacter sp. R933-2]MDM1769362.1 iron ABC transporter permease [Acinetobacter sp. 226-4]MDQ9021814.1 iron ABC transporter permease [Acinetobacter sichuanensis]